MPHDCKGNELSVGDRVMLEGEVTSISPGETACNVTVQIDAPEGEYSPSVTGNSKSVTKVE